MKNKVVIIGGGVAGLSAAHELAERRFEVTIYERRLRFGGKAASVDTLHGFPAEHGFRFFPGWYRHLPDTMKRISYRNGTSVYDNLVVASENVFASYTRDPIRALLRLPRSFNDVKTLASFPERLAQVGLTTDDFAFFLGKLNRFAALPDTERKREYGKLSWWQFMEADTRSKQFRNYLVDGITRNTIAAKADEASAYTVALVAIRTMLDVVSPISQVDRVLNGPSNEVWIDPWVAHLSAKGVQLITDAELDTIEFDGPSIAGVRFIQGNFARRECEARVAAVKLMQELLGGPLKTPLQMDANGPTLAEVAEAWKRRVLEDEPALQSLIESLQAEVRSADDSGRLNALTTELNRKLYGVHQVLAAGRAQADELFKQAQASLVNALRDIQQRSTERVQADYYIFALPVEQMAYYVHRSEMLRYHDPSLRNIVRLSNHVGWMAGLQFYLTVDEGYTRGHIDCLDSEWHLTALFQGQFWSDIDLRRRGTAPFQGSVRTVLSVDISAWDKKGRLHRREAFSCSPKEIAEEVWHQLKQSLNRPGQAPVLRDEMLLSWRAEQPMSPDAYHLDESIVDRFDRKKQAFYQKFESVRFSHDALIAQNAHASSDDHGASFAHGNRLRLNAEPLLINRAGGLELQPLHTTEVRNMYLAADYVQTHTHLATMEAANEAARLAVNEILKDAGDERMCELFYAEPFELAKTFAMTLLTPAGLAGAEMLERPAQAAAAAASMATKVASAAFAKLLTRRR